MKQDSIKLIALLDSYHLVLYEAKGNKIIKGPTKVEGVFSHHPRPEKNHGSYDSSFGFSISGGPPHTMPKEIDENETAKLTNNHLEVLFKNNPTYQELVIAAEPRMLGHIRQHLSKELRKKLTREIHKDLLNSSIESIENELKN